MNFYCLLAFFCVVAAGCSATKTTGSGAAVSGDYAPDFTVIRLADPTIFSHNGTYYLYGTSARSNYGFEVYTSRDLKKWTGPVGVTNGYALVTGDSYGTKGFWAPQVFYHNKKFYMAYTANEQIAIAESESPLGPFKQKDIRPVSTDGKQIDPFVFFDNGKPYLYHVRLNNGNRLYVVELTNDLADIKPATLSFCLAATDLPWENTAASKWPVSEGPTVIKHKNLYYLFYSANDFRNIDYAVGYAVSENLTGPWTKNEQPIISRQNIGLNGTGHGDFFYDKKHRLHYVLHTHNGNATVSPRLTAVVQAKFVSAAGRDTMQVLKNTFHLLKKNK